MANTGVLPFVRGINFAKNDFKVSVINNNDFPIGSSVSKFIQKFLNDFS